jgi:heptosyltransferase I
MLIVKTTSLGDVIHNLPVIHDIHTHFSDMEIDWLVEESFADIPRMHPGIAEVKTVALRRWRKKLFSKATWNEIALLKKQLRAKAYDLVLDTQGLVKSALLARLADAPRHGYDRHSIREPLASCFYDVKHAVSRAQHAVPRNRELAAAALGYPNPTSHPDYGIQPEGEVPELPSRYVIGLHGTSRDSKLWPVSHWIDLAHDLYQHQLALILPWGNVQEYDRANDIALMTPHTVVLPRLGLPALALITQGAQAAVGVDTGLMHLAVALKKTSIAIYTDTDPALTGLYPGDHTIAVNLGGKQQEPTVADVMHQLSLQNAL